MASGLQRLASLRYSHRMRLVQAIADRVRHRMTTEDGARWSKVLEIGCGTKTRGGQFMAGRPPCVKILVRKKIRGYVHALPTEIRIRHGRQTYRVLTDVEEFDAARFRLQSAVDIAAEVRAIAVGSLGFVMQDGSSARYVVSASHVLQPGTATWTKDGRSGNGQVLDQFRYRPGPTGQGVIDAAPARVAAPGPIAPPPNIPFGDSVATWEGVLQVGKVFVCGKHGIVPATVAFRVPTLPGMQVLERVLICKFDDGMRTADGDSGAPILTQNGGRLVGIHVGIYPDPAASPPPYHSVGHVAGDLLDHFSALLQGDLRLWKP